EVFVADWMERAAVRRSWSALAIGLALAGLVAGCAARSAAMPEMPATPAHPDFVYPDVVDASGGALATQIERGWRYLQANNLKSAEREFGGAVKRAPDSPAAHAALGYAGLARGDAEAALASFERSLL